VTAKEESRAPGILLAYPNLGSELSYGIPTGKACTFR